MSTASVSAVKKVGALLKIKDAASALSLSPKSVLRLINDDSLHAVDVSGRRNRRRRSLRIPAEEVQRFLGANSTHKTSAEND